MNLNAVLNNYYLRIDDETNKTLDTINECLLQSEQQIDEEFKRIFMRNTNQR